MSEMHVMDRKGHTTTAWDADNEAEVRVAKETFDRMTAQGYRAFRIRGKDQQGERMATFDPTAEQMIMVPHLAGG